MTVNMFTKIDSVNNNIFKHIKSLLQKKFRDDESEFIVEGIKPLYDAILCNAEVSFVVLNENFDIEILTSEAKKFIDNCKTYIFAEKLFNAVSDTKTPQGLLFVCKKNSNDFTAEMLDNEFCVYCDCVSDPGNIGTIVRTAAASGAKFVALSENCADLYSPKVIRATMGCIFHIDVYTNVNSKDAINMFKNKGVKIVSSCLTNAQNFYETTLQFPLCLVIGNEAHGISDEFYNNSDSLVKIPMENSVESLNAGVASGILMYDIKRRI